MDTTIVTTIVLTSITTAVSTYIFTRRSMSSYHKTVGDLDFQTNKNELIDRTKSSFVESPDFISRLNNEYLRGKEDGRKEEIAKFSIIYEPFQEVTEEYMGLRKRAELGYSTQLYYSGLPIGESFRKTTHKNVEFDEKKIDKLMNSELLSSLNNMCQLLLTKGIGSKVLPLKR